MKAYDRAVRFVLNFVMVITLIINAVIILSHFKNSFVFNRPHTVGSVLILYFLSPSIVLKSLIISCIRDKIKARVAITVRVVILSILAL